MDGELGKNVKVVASQPRISLPLCAIAGVSRGDEVVLSDAHVFGETPVRFRVLEIILEGTGWATIPLVKI